MKLSKKLENLFSAAAFAEEGEFEAARQMAGEDASEPRRARAADDLKPAAPRIKHGHLAPKA
ncbi:MAG: hypothetical protein HZB44_00750 [Actinobacteria bacterium]|nr:hypothetical protein [Actinomycetota bacterium]